VLISTFERPGLLLEALAQVAAQDYGGDVEAVVVDDSAESLEGRSTAAEVLCVWDDDDVFTRHRLRRQVEHLLGWDGGGGVPCSGIEVAYMYSVPTRGLSFRPPRLPQLVFENTLSSRATGGRRAATASESRGRCRARARAPWSPGGSRSAL
ncbi:unnamed protein product, partial [Prorocentrum cordatum]